MHRENNSKDLTVLAPMKLMARSSGPARWRSIAAGAKFPKNFEETRGINPDNEEGKNGPKDETMRWRYYETSTSKTLPTTDIFHVHGQAQ